MGRSKVFKPGDWYTSPMYRSRYLFYRIGGYTEHIDGNGWSSIHYDMQIDQEGLVRYDSLNQSNPFYEKLMVKVPMKIINIILYRKGDYQNLIDLYKQALPKAQEIPF